MLRTKTKLTGAAMVAKAAVVAVMILSSVGAYAQDVMSAGVYVGSISDFTGGPMSVSVSRLGIDTARTEHSVPWTGFTFGGFFEPSYYLELGAGLTVGFGSREISGDEATGNYEADISMVNLDLSAFGRYPFYKLGGMIVSATAGINYALTLSASVKYSNGDDGTVNDPIDLSKLWMKFGLTASVPIAMQSRLYVRGSALYGVGFASKVQSDLVDDVVTSGLPPGVNVSPILNHGLDIRANVGYRF